LIESLSETIAPLAVDKPPLTVPRAALRGSHWIEPKLSAKWPSRIHLGRRASPPKLHRLREDKPARRGARSPQAAAQVGKENDGRPRVRRRISNPTPDLSEGRPDQGGPANYYAAIDLVMVDAGAARRP
jgi:bifunctional non-homologous end joining protein LigD